MSGDTPATGVLVFSACRRYSNGSVGMVIFSAVLMSGDTSVTGVIARRRYSVNSLNVDTSPKTVSLIRHGNCPVLLD